MTKTLADMTTEERADCVGMWVQTPGNQLAIIANTGTTHMSWLIFPRRAGDRNVYENQQVTPRHDLPRAWTPDGEPVLAQALAEETWEYAVAVKSTNGTGYLDRFGQPQSWLRITAWYSTKENAQASLIGSEYRKETLCIVRRRVSPPEVVE